MKKVTVGNLIKTVAKRWKNQYFLDDRWYDDKSLFDAQEIYEKLLKSPASAGEIIGVRSWIHPWCSECNKERNEVIELDGGDTLCPSCLRKAKKLFEEN